MIPPDDEPRTLSTADARTLVDACRRVAATASRSLDDALDVLVEESRTLLAADGAAIVLATEAPGRFVFHRRSGLGRGDGGHDPPDEYEADAFVREATAARAPLFTADFQGDTRIDTAGKRRHPTVRATMAVPLLAAPNGRAAEAPSGQPELVGFVFVHWTRDFVAGARDNAIAQVIADHAAVAVRAILALEAERRARAQVQLAGAELEALMDAAPDAIMVFAPDGRMVRANAPARSGIEKLLGGAPATIDALHRIAEPRHVDDSPTTPTGFERAIAGERVEELLSWRDSDGERRYMHVVLAPVRDGADRVRAAVIVGRDIDVVREAFAEPARVEGAILTARLVAHELNTKLQIVTGYGSLLQRSVDAETRELLEQMVEAADEAGRIVARLQQIIRVTVTDAGAGPMLDLETATDRR